MSDRMDVLGRDELLDALVAMTKARDLIEQHATAALTERDELRREVKRLHTSHQGAVDTIERLADLTDGLPFEETDTPEQLIERAIGLAHQLHGGR